MKLNGKRAVVTGGAAGIGLATASRLLDAGCVVTIWDVDADALASARGVLRKNGGTVHARICNVADRESVGAAVRAAEQEMGGIDILINNAGHLAPGDFLDQPVEVWQRTIEVNVDGILLTTHAVLPGMFSRNSGHIVNISSAAGMLGVAGLAVYAASKWAVWGLTESLRHEAWNLGKRGVRFSTVHPSYVAEGLFAGARMRGLGALIVPRIRDHDVVARAIVEAALIRGRNSPKRPRSVRAAVFFRGVLPDSLFQRLIRVLNIHRSMSTWRGKQNGEGS